MSKTIRVSHGLCSAIRPKVLTALEPYGVRVLDITAWGEGHWHQEVPDWMVFPDADAWVRKHVCDVTVSDGQAAWAERLLWQSHRVDLETPKINRNLVWTAPEACTAGAHGTLGRGAMPTPWSAGKGKRRQQRVRRTRRQQDAGGLLGTLARWFR